MATPILPVPHLPQRKQGECLAACAAMMLNYLGHSVSYDKLLIFQMPLFKLLGASLIWLGWKKMKFTRF